MLELRAEEVKDGGGSGEAAVLYASFHGWQKMESPPMGASFCSEKPGEGYFRGWKIKRERVKKSEWGVGVGKGVSCHRMGQIKPQLADFIHPLPPTLPIIHFSIPNRLPSFLSSLPEITHQSVGHSWIQLLSPTRVFCVVANSLVIQQQKKIGRGLKTLVKHS